MGKKCVVLLSPRMASPTRTLQPLYSPNSVENALFWESGIVLVATNRSTYNNPVSVCV